MKSFDVLFNDASLIQLGQSLGWEYVRANKADIVFFPGGPDVDPIYYGERPHRSTSFNTPKNVTEAKAFHGLPISTLKIGICGGGQILNVLNGGKMFQDSDHPGRHSLTVQLPGQNPLVYQVNSTHHQLMRLGPSAELWGWTRLANYRISMSEKEKDDEMDNEIVWYPKTNSFCFQPHPEYGHKETTELFTECMKQLGAI